MDASSIIPPIAGFSGFTETDFDTFRIDGLEPRMEAIRFRIQPKFHAIAAALIDDVSVFTGTEQFLHVAKHARRKVNAPIDTWMSFSHNKRGYKQHPHFQIGLFDDRVFIWLALIYELPDKKSIAGRLLNHSDEIAPLLGTDYVASFNHMKKDAVALKELGPEGWAEAVGRFRDIKSAELLIGRNLAADDPVVRDGARFLELAKETFHTLASLYRVAIN